MIKENTVMFRLPVDVKPSDVKYKITPNLIPFKEKWIPQTLGEQVWLFFEFQDQEGKKEYLDWINVCDLKFTHPHLHGYFKPGTLTPSEMLMELDQATFDNYTGGKLLA